MTNFLLSTLADVFFPEYIQLAKLFCCASQIQALCIIKCLYVCMYVPMYVVITKLKVLVHGNSFVVYVMLCYTENLQVFFTHSVVVVVVVVVE